MYITGRFAPTYHLESAARALDAYANTKNIDVASITTTIRSHDEYNTCLIPRLLPILTRISIVACFKGGLEENINTSGQKFLFLPEKYILPEQQLSGPFTDLAVDEAWTSQIMHPKQNACCKDCHARNQCQVVFPNTGYQDLKQTAEGSGMKFTLPTESHPRQALHRFEASSPESIFAC